MATNPHTVLVTGAAGFIGSNVVPALLERGYRVIALDNFDDTYDRAFKEQHLAPFKDNAQCEFLQLDVRDKDALREVFAKECPVYVIHLAAKADTRAAVDDPYPYVENNIYGLLNLLEAAKEFPVKNFVFVSSSSVYGNDIDMPLSENAPAVRPLSPYGATKRAGELFAYTYHHNFGMNITCLRYFNAYGENNRPSMVPYKWGLALLRGEEIEMSGKGTRSRDYTYVGDIVRGTVMAMEHPLGFEILNLGNSNPLSLRELLSVLEEATGVTAIVRERPSHPASVERTFADVSKAKEVLGWEPEVSTKVGMARLIAWLRTNRL